MLFKKESIFYNEFEGRIRALWRIAIQFILFLLLFTIFPVFFKLLFLNDFYYTFVFDVIYLGIGLLTIFFATKYLDFRKIKDLGLKFSKKWRRDLLAGMLIGIIAITSMFLLELITGNVRIIEYKHSTVGGNFYLELLIRFLGYGCVAVLEEVYSRGYQLKNLAEGMNIEYNYPISGVLFGWIVSSIIFAMMHLLNPNATAQGILNLVFIGMMYGYAAILTGSLAMPIGIHLTWNFMMGNIFGYSVSGFLPFVSLLKTEVNSHPMINNPKFGPEAGMIILIPTFICFILIYIRQNYIVNSGNIKKGIAIYP